MVDQYGKNSADQFQIVGSDNDNCAHVNENEELSVKDTPNNGAVNGILALTTTAIEAKVGANAKVERKYITMQALTKNVKWGYDTNCIFDLFKNQFFDLPYGDGITVYFKSSTGTASVALGER